MILYYYKSKYPVKSRPRRISNRGMNMTPDKNTEEQRQHSTSYIPYSHYECRLPESFMNVPMHWHSEFELNYISDGQGEFICGGQKIEAAKGDILILPPNMLHSAYPCKDRELIYHALVFHPVLLGNPGSDRSSVECIRPVVSRNAQVNVHIHPGMEAYDSIKDVTEQIFACVRADSAQMDLLLKSELMKLFWLLENSGNIICQNKDTGAEYHELIRPVLEYMSRNLQEEICIEQLAGLVHLSKSHFMRCFNDTVGVGAMEHLTQLRISAACEALSNTQDKISDISYRCGYSNLSNFNRQFLKKVGCSPNEYRKRSL